MSLLLKIFSAAVAVCAFSVFRAAAADAAASPGDPAPTLASPKSAERNPDADGFLPRWIILDPIPFKGQLTDNSVRSAVASEYFTNQLSVVPRDGDRVKVGDKELEWHAVDTTDYNVNLYHFARSHNQPSSFVLFWAVTVVNCPQEMNGVRLAIGSNAASVWWVNGQEVIGIYGDRQTVIDDGVSKRLTLRKGPNIIRCAVINGGGATDFCARFLGADEKPLKNFNIRLNEVADKKP